MQPILWVIAGANGVGKTRYARAHIEAVTGSRRFVNLDEIARGLSPFDPSAEQVAAARIVLARLDDFIAGRSLNGNPVVTLETTLSGRSYLRVLRQACAVGVHVHLLYFAVRNVETAVERVARRVSEGGHDVPEVDLRRRFDRSLKNFNAYAALANNWRVFDNNRHMPLTVAEGVAGCKTHLVDDLSGLPKPLADVLLAMPRCD